MGRPAMLEQQGGGGLSAADLDRLRLDIRRLQEECGASLCGPYNMQYSRQQGLAAGALAQIDGVC